MVIAGTSRASSDSRSSRRRVVGRVNVLRALNRRVKRVRIDHLGQLSGGTGLHPATGHGLHQDCETSGSWRSSFRKIKSVEESKPRAINSVLHEDRLTASATGTVFPTCHQFTTIGTRGLKEPPAPL